MPKNMVKGLERQDTRMAEVTWVVQPREMETERKPQGGLQKRGRY